MKFIMKQSGRRWQGVRILALEEFPAAPESTGTLPDSILRICSASRFHCELAAMKKKESDRMYLMLILRWSGVSREELEQRMERDSDILQKQFSASQILTEFVESTDKGKTVYLPLLMHYTEKEEQTGDKLSRAFCPREPETGTDPLYLPGTWSPEQSFSGSANAVNMDEIITILSQYDEFLFSFQLIPTVLFPVEAEEIRRSVQWMNQQKAIRTKAEGTRFISLLQAEGRPMYLAQLWICCGAEPARDISLYLQKKGLSPVILPLNFFSSSGYPMSGDQKLTDYLNRFGHRKGYTGSRLHPALQRLTRLVTEEEAHRCFPLPAKWDSLRGITLHRTEIQPVLLPEPMRAGSGSVYIGRQEKTDREVYLPLGDITRHGCITGKPGSGKTTFALGFLYRLYRQKRPVPFLAIEPAKKEYRTLMDCLPELKVYTPGASGVSPMQMNLFLPPEGVTLEEYLPCVDQIFDMSFSMTSLLKDIFTKVIRKCYNLYGWRNESTRDSAGVQFFGLHEFIREFRRYARDNIYDPESRNNVENSGVLRLQKLLNTSPVMFDTVRAPDYRKMLSEPTVIELDAVSDPIQKSMVMAIIIVNLMALIRKRTDFTGDIQNVILIDEAHVILNPEDRQRDTDAADPGHAALKLLQNMTLILRAYGTALVFGDQSPAKLTKEILGNVNMKIMFQLDDPEDRSILGQTALMDQAMLDEMVFLKPGQGFLSCSRTGKPVFLQTPNTEKELNIKKNLPDQTVTERMKSDQDAPFTQCIRCELCGGKCSLQIRNDAGFLAQSVLNQSRRIRDILPADPGKAGKTQAALPAYLKEEFAGEAGKIAEEKGIVWTERLAACAEIQMIRELLISGSCMLNEKQLRGEEEIIPEEDNADPENISFSNLFRR